MSNLTNIATADAFKDQSVSFFSELELPHTCTLQDCGE